MDTQKIEVAVIDATIRAFCQNRAFAQRVQDEAVRQLVAQARASILPSLNFAESLRPRIEAEVEAEFSRQRGSIRETADRLIASAWNSRFGNIAQSIEHHVRASIKDALVSALRQKLVVKDGAIRFEESP